MLRLQKNIRPHSRIKLSYLNTTNILTLTSGTQSVNWIFFLNTSIRILAHQNISFSGSYFPDVLCLLVVCYSTCNHRNSAIQCSRINSLFICQTGRVCCMEKCVVKTIRKKKREQFVWLRFWLLEDILSNFLVISRWSFALANEIGDPLKTN